MHGELEQRILPVRLGHEEGVQLHDSLGSGAARKCIFVLIVFDVVLKDGVSALPVASGAGLVSPQLLQVSGLEDKSRFNTGRDVNVLATVRSTAKTKC